MRSPVLSIEAFRFNLKSTTLLQSCLVVHNLTPPELDLRQLFRRVAAQRGQCKRRFAADLLKTCVEPGVEFCLKIFDRWAPRCRDVNQNARHPKNEIDTVYRATEIAYAMQPERRSRSWSFRLTNLSSSAFPSCTGWLRQREMKSR